MTREQRQSIRKALSAGGILSMDGAQHRLHTIDISAGGVSIAIPKQLTVRRNCHLQFELMIDGQSHVVAGSCHIVYCFFTGGKAYRAGLQFLSIALDGAALIARYIAAQQSP